VNPVDVVNEFTVAGGARALRARPPSIVASRRDGERAAHDLHRIVRAARRSKSGEADKVDLAWIGEIVAQAM
jgi:hypothetical protein